MKLGLRNLAASFKSFDPDSGRGQALEFARVAREYPLYAPNRVLQVPVVWMSHFAELGYCSYKAWHEGAGTEVRRPARVERLKEQGKVVHEEKVAVELAEARKLPKATPKTLRDPRVDIYRIPEMPAQIRVGELVYSSSIERAGRVSGELVVTEIKTGNYAFAPDHLLQVWGYCLSAPGALHKLTNGDFQATSVTWALEYPAREKTYGPYPFAGETSTMLRDAMQLFERLYLAGHAGVTDLPVDYVGPSPPKCAVCAYSHACAWRAAPPSP